jgi:metal-sulfur cluster biosynthetic enzyme
LKVYLISSKLGFWEIRILKIFKKKMPIFPKTKISKIEKKKFKKWNPFSLQLFFYLKYILDPEFPYKIYALGIICFEKIFIKIFFFFKCVSFNILINPTNQICSMSPLIARCIENKLNKKKLAKKLDEIIPSKWNWKFSFEIPFYSHLRSLNISKQINDKERKSAAMENIGIRQIIAKSYEEF